MKSKRGRTPVIPKPGDRVMVVSGPWKDQVGTYKGTEETLVGIRHRVSLDNGFGTLIQLKQMKRLRR
jgi:transcription antitermination factor NusG